MACHIYYQIVNSFLQIDRRIKQESSNNKYASITQSQQNSLRDISNELIFILLFLHIHLNSCHFRTVFKCLFCYNFGLFCLINNNNKKDPSNKQQKLLISIIQQQKTQNIISKTLKIKLSIFCKFSHQQEVKGEHSTRMIHKMKFKKRFHISSA